MGLPAPHIHPMQTNTLDEVLGYACSHGKLHVFQSEYVEGWSCTIRFQTASHIKLEAKSGFGHDSMKAALLGAIQTAEEIKKEFG
jgi:hypothetical protein